MKPIVPKMRMGGKFFTVSRPERSKALYETEFDKAKVGM